MSEPRPFTIVADVAPASRFPRVWRLPVVLVGIVFTVVGLAGVGVLIAVVGLCIVARSAEGFTDPVACAWIAGITVVGYVLLRIGVRLLRGERRSALFLRRFGFTDATRVLSAAIARGLGRRWRLITLDDLRVVPVGLARRRWIVRVAPWLLLVAIVVAVLWFLPDWAQREADEAIAEATAEAEAEGASFGEQIVGPIFIGAIVWMLLIFMIGVLLVVIGAMAVFGIGTNVAARRAEGRRAVRIDRAGQVEDAVRKAERATNRVYAPRLTVVRCANEVWQSVIRRFAAATDATLIDVSEPSGGLLWELTELGGTLKTTWILVGRYDRLVALQTDPSPDAVRLRSVLDGQSVLAYDLADTPRFERALQARLTHVR